MLKRFASMCAGLVLVMGPLDHSTPAAEPADTPMIFRDFQTWTDKFLKASDAGTKAALEKQGATLAAQRRVAMTNLIQSMPRRALELALPAALRKELPASVAQHVEEHIDGRGHFGVLIADDFAGGKSETHRTVTINDRTYRAFVFGRKVDQTSETNVPLRGVALGDVMALDDWPQA